jgi:serine/threonine protein phosphatase PrpC
LLNEKELNEKNIENVFLQTDKNLKEENTNDFTGSTCVCCFIEIKNDKEVTLTCCNVGDSRCVFYYNKEIIPMSIDQKPNGAIEKQRIEKSGQSVVLGRINGKLAVARSFGDYYYKSNEKLKDDEQSVIAVPVVKEYKFQLNENLNFLILACDGLWDVMVC